MLLAGSAAALSLGPAKGTVLLGAPLDLVFEVEPDPGTSVASSCVTADVLVGDVSVASEKVRVVPLPEMPGRAAAVRVRASIAVDEPVVQVKLSAGCSGKVSRTYTFLADLPVGASSSAPVDIARIAPPQSQADGREAGLLAGTAAGAAGARSSLADGSIPSAKPRTRPAARPAARPVRVRERPPPQAPKAAAQARPVASAPVTAPPARSRLVMEPLDGLGAGLGADAPAALRSSPELASAPPLASTPQRAEAAASWKALNASGAGVQSDTERMHALEAELATLRARSAEQQTGVAQLQRRLDAMEKERFAAALGLCVAGLAGGGGADFDLVLAAGAARGQTRGRVLARCSRCGGAQWCRRQGCSARGHAAFGARQPGCTRSRAFCSKRACCPSCAPAFGHAPKAGCGIAYRAFDGSHRFFVGVFVWAYGGAYRPPRGAFRCAAAGRILHFGGRARAGR